MPSRANCSVRNAWQRVAVGHVPGSKEECVPWRVALELAARVSVALLLLLSGRH
jgi:hypothetical protein